MKSPLPNCVVLLLLVAGSVHLLSQVLRLDPPDRSFFSKYINCGEIKVEASASVADQALLAGCAKINLMLQNIPIARRNLVSAGAELHVIGKNEATSDLPEHAARKGEIFVDRQGRPSKGAPTIDQRTRGLGDIDASCGEENLLGLAKDRYRGQDICIHELAHALQNFGLSEDVRALISRQYASSLRGQRWHGAYAAKNDGEYFAELSMWYFGTHGELSMEGEKPGNGREGLRRYDADAFRLLDALYSGVIPIEAIRTMDLQATLAAPGVRMRSRGGGAKAELILKNRTIRDLDVFWIDLRDESHSYGTLRANEDRTLSTFNGHLWMLAEAGRPWLYYVARAPRCVAVIRE